MRKSSETWPRRTMLEEVKRNMATKQDIVLVRQEMKTALTQNKFDMIKWMTGYFLSGLALMAALVKLT